MANAAMPIGQGREVQELLRHITPSPSDGNGLYQRLVAINELSVSMNAANDVDGVIRCLEIYCSRYFPEDPVRLCIQAGSKYRKVHISGPESPADASLVSMNEGIAGSAMKSQVAMWIPDAYATETISCNSSTGADIPVRSLLVLPFSVMKSGAGCLEMTSAHTNRFTEMEYHLGLLIASHLATSLDKVLTKQELATANARLKDQDLCLTQLNEKLELLAHTDETTGLFNKRRLYERLDMEVARARRYGETLSCLMIDVDDFKAVNDTYGHQAGDMILRQIGELLQRSLRVTDFKARYGGEEFTVLLPRTNSAGAFCVSENLRTAFASNDFVVPSKNLHLTVSIGVASCSRFDNLSPQQVIRLADRALYRAKRGGKNRVCFAKEDETADFAS